MIKRILAAWLTLILTFSCIAVLAEDKETEHIVNGDFEAWTKGSTPSGWALKGGSAGSNLNLITDDVVSGKNAASFKTTGSGIYIQQAIKSLIPGEEYTFSGWAKGGEGAAITLDFYGDGGASLGRVIKGFESSKKWAEVIESFTAPQGVTSTVFLLRNVNTSSEVFWDKVSISGKGGFDPAKAVLMAAEEVKEETYTYVEKPEFAQEMTRNSSFENGTNEWSAFGGSWDNNQYVSVSTEEKHSGLKSMKITSTEGNSPWANQRIDGSYFEAQAVYQISTWVYVKSGDQVGFKLEWYSDDSINSGGSAKTMNGPTNGWVQYITQFTMPTNCSYFKFYIRLYSIGTVYFDDVSFYKIKEAPIHALSVDTDEVFYYTGAEKGVASIELNDKHFPDITKGTVDFNLKAENEILYEKTSIRTEGTSLKVEYPVSQMKEGTEYMVSATVRDENGTEIETVTEKIMKYKRPDMLAEDGGIIIDGKPFYPVFAYHVRATELQYMAEIGVNVVQSTDQSTAYLDAAEKLGIKVLVRMYPNMKPAGHPDNVQNTIDVVTRIKTHPALFGYMVMDEPTLYFPNNWEYFYDSYKIIRNLDPAHVIYMIQDSGSYYEKVGKYTDILAIDPYPSSIDRVSRGGDYTDRAVKAVDFAKPVWTLNQAFLYMGYFPTINESRNLWYQALFAGATSVGYYSFYDAYTENGVTKKLNETELWPGLVKFAKEELPESYNYFLKHEYPVFGNYRGNDVWWSAYVKDGSVYMIVLNRENKKKTVSIPLKSDGGTVSVGAYTGQLVYGGQGTVSGNGALNISIENNGAHVYKLTPSETTDFSSLYVFGKSRDLNDYSWAAEQVRKLESLDIVNVDSAAYRPADNITRGEFAYFLVRTLGLTSDSTENFKDVDENAFYANEVAVGKALGVLKGVGDNTYNPEEAISRQDLMVICARGIRLVKNMEEGAGETLSVYSDSNVIADYAVLDVAAMVRASIVRGNADGTINPRGNTTRAEAAVVMSRILDFKEAS